MKIGILIISAFLYLAYPYAARDSMGGDGDITPVTTAGRDHHSNKKAKRPTKSIFDNPDTNVNDTIIEIRLEGKSCPYADYADYGIFIPGTRSPLQGAIIFQHGCGMENAGVTRPHDLQYQAFAKKWNLAIIESALYGDCHVWKEPNSGSARALLDILNSAGLSSGHPELETVPWLLWGHSAGGYWSLAMLRDYPERIIAIVSYSAALYPQWDYSPLAAKVPLLLRHAGANDGSPEIRCEETAIHTFKKLRAMDAPVSIAYNEGQNHNFSYIRYMAIPFFEAALKQRLSDTHLPKLREIDRNKSWLGDTLSLNIFKESDYSGKKNGMCRFPDETTARNWIEFVSTGTVIDKTPPPPPFDVTATPVGNNELIITWKSQSDIESGILKFNIYVDDQLIGQLPEQGSYQTFDPNGDNTVPPIVPAMKYTISISKKGKTRISIESVNHFHLVSQKTDIIYKYNNK